MSLSGAMGCGVGHLCIGGGFIVMADRYTFLIIVIWHNCCSQRMNVNVYIFFLATLYLGHTEVGNDVSSQLPISEVS